MTVSIDDHRAPYIQVADALREEIRSGKLQPGQKLPSARQLADRFKVAVMTASSGVRVLREEGLVSSTQGRGTFVRQAGELAPAVQAADVPVDRVDALEAEVRRLSERLAAVEAELARQGQ
ncbi:GntR family transcriptional regulator [Streptomyces sp. TLI_235]|nr:GntR family transcriptional regulator [Streptomyces sp. TLI_235]PBC79043.1 GntR family transcriptional regulator [Streptomyces sp. TLI_235]